MARLTYDQVAKLAMDAGWRGKDAQTAVAIARAESQFDPMATNFKRKDHSYGLWQINMKDAMGPERRAKYGLASNEALFNPETNARVAHAIWKERGGWTDWGAYTNGSWALYRNHAILAVKRIEQGLKPSELPDLDLSDDSHGSKTIGPDIPGPGDIGKAIGDIGGFLTNRENWLRAAAIIGGGILLILAVFLIMSDTVVGVALKRVGKAGKVVKAVT